MGLYSTLLGMLRCLLNKQRKKPNRVRVWLPFQKVSTYKFIPTAYSNCETGLVSLFPTSAARFGNLSPFQLLFEPFGN